MNGIPANQVSLQNANSVSLASQQRNTPTPVFSAMEFEYAVPVCAQLDAPGWLLRCQRNASREPEGYELCDVAWPGKYQLSASLHEHIHSHLCSDHRGAGSRSYHFAFGLYSANGVCREASNFNSMQAKVTHEMSARLYGFSSLDMVQGDGQYLRLNPAGSAPGYNYQNPANLKGEYGQLATQLSQAFVFSGLWDLPYGHGRKFGANIAPWANAVRAAGV